MTLSSHVVAQHVDLPLELQKIVSRMSRDGDEFAEIGTIGAAATRIILLEHALSSLLNLMEDTPYPERHASVRDARTLVQGC